MAITLDGTNGFRDTGTGALGLPTGTTAQRPASPTNGYMRYNTDTTNVETYINGAWISTVIGQFIADILLVGGGASGGGGAAAGYPGGGGGAGGMVQLFGTGLKRGTSYVVTVGAGGATPAPWYQGNQGGNTTFNQIVAYGGGFGLSGQGYAGANTVGGSGGSGGGGTHAHNPAGAGTFGQGHHGGNGYWDGSYMKVGGGGGAGAPAVTPLAGSQTGSGGAGSMSMLSGNPTYYAGGGAGGGSDSQHHSSPAPGGIGGGAGGGYATQPVSSPANTGGGGGGGARNGGGGGSGVVIIRYFGPQKAVGGIVTSDAGYTTHTFNNSDTFVVA